MAAQVETHNVDSATMWTMFSVRLGLVSTVNAGISDRCLYKHSNMVQNVCGLQPLRREVQERQWS